MSEDAHRRLEAFIDRYAPEVAALGRAVLADLRTRLPHANVLVYDNYNALAAGFAPDESAGHVILSLAFYPRWVSLFFFNGPRLDDPGGLLEGSGSTVRHVKMRRLEDFQRAEVEALIEQALALADPPLAPDHRGRLIIKSVSAKQRPRRPA
ncbi:DUF1801 domain-containing protein [Croceibacterium aestuarii]|uniref:DUF1801 domain-containing protein n=1 Tax=Croceibacterium aestuarii TaxID=3064139 RepID=UPI00272EAC0F|nr:DUF1801 domain-containing protein [Croceibacterium sp. D39]